MLVLAVSAALAGFAGLVVAQEGHPMTGTWHGSWKAASQDAKGPDSKPVVFFLRWDNKNIVGEINPGRNSMPIKVATLDPSKWALHMEAVAKDGSTVVIDGTLENLGSYNRTLKGTWTQGSAKGALEMTRD